MLRGLKKFISKKLLTPEHPFFWALQTRRLLAKMERHSRMSYAEIEAEIGRQYQQMFGRKLDWDNPKTYNEKIHVSKVYMPSPLKTRLADKYLVRQWITEKIGSEYLIPLLGVYDSFDEIDFDSLPNQFVIKCTHDSGSYTLVKDKNKINKDVLRRKYNAFMRRNYAWAGWEMHYRDITPRIVIDKYIDNAAVNDFRFYCFDGKPCYCAVDFYGSAHQRNARNIYDMNWDIQPFILQYPNYEGSVPCPDNFMELKGIAQNLADGFSQVRVDLYSAGGRVYFGEMTFAHANGFQKLIPDEWDCKLGDLWPFDTTVRAKVLSEHSHP